MTGVPAGSGPAQGQVAFDSGSAITARADAPWEFSASMGRGRSQQARRDRRPDGD